jgi:SIR2-like domain
MPDLSKLSDLPALKQLARALWHNGSIRGAAVMVGAGFSKNAILQAPDAREAPSWNELLDELVAQLYPTDPSSAPKDALRIAEEYRTYFGQATLDGFIRTRFTDRAWLPGPLHLQALNLPWSDILTTNWDTLLERTAEEVTDYIYEIVRTEADIAHARSPRIIKLHGNLGDKDPLIFAAEDYRTYPTRHAAFVNLARQIFIENDLCLLGFSGNDPNFLEWTGWVRDHLGGQSRRIYLVGYLNLSASARKYMETHNIAPVDLAPLVSHLPAKDRYSAATKIFLDALWAEQPPAPDDWKRHASGEYPAHKNEFFDRARNDQVFATEALKETAGLLRDDRRSYPGWLVCPREYRLGPQSGYGEWAIFKPTVLACVEPSERASILSEFLWRYTTSLYDLPLLFRDALVSIMGEPQSAIEQSYRLEFAVALMRDARVEGNNANLERWGAIVEAEADPEAPERTEGQYQRCLHLRDQLDFAALAKALNSLSSDDPLWRLRKAGLYTEAGEYLKANRLIKDVVAEYQKAYRFNRNSVWIKSCLSWASWLNRVAAMGHFNRRSELPRASDFRSFKIDPEGELQALEDDGEKLRRKQQEDDGAVVPLFEAGSYRPGAQQAQARPDSQAILSLHELDQLMEFTGIPLRINHVQVAAEAASSLMKVTHHYSDRWYLWLLRTLHSQFDNLFIRYFGRIGIAQLPQDIAEKLCRKLEASIAFWRNRNAISVGEENTDNRSIAVDELRLALTAQSHMTVRMTEDEAVRAFRLGVHIAEDSSATHRWVIEAAGELAKYALEAMPLDRRASMVLDVLKFPLATERGGFTATWPDLMGVVTNVKPLRDSEDVRWDRRIGELVAAAAPNAPGRIEATNRLAYLALNDALKPSERENFAIALWGKTDNNTEPLPADTQLLASTVAELPAPGGIDPIARVKARIFDRDLTDVMDCSDPVDPRVMSEKQNHLISLYNTGPLGLSMPAARAAQLFDQVVAWSPSPIAYAEPFAAGFKQNFDEFVKRQVGEVLTSAVVPAMTIEDRSETRLRALLSFIDRTKSWHAVGALPNFLESVPTMDEAIVLAMHRGLSAAEYVRVSASAAALVRWSHLITTRGLKPVSRRLTEQLLSMIETRQEEGLHTLLNAAFILVDEGVLSAEDATRLKNALSDLREEAKYSDVLFNSRRAVSISLVRQQCVRLARLLKQKILDDGTLAAWLEEGRLDPLPEVRFAAQME